MGAMTLNVRIGEALAVHVGDNIGEYGLYENASEYVRDLIRRDLARVEGERFAALKAELQRAFATPDSEFVDVSAQDVIDRGRARHAG